MLYLVLSWTLLSIICVTAGKAVLNIFHTEAFSRRGDRLIAAIWLGLTALSLAYLATALVLPLSTTTSIGVVFTLMTMALCSKATRRELKHLVRPGYFFTGCLLVLCVELVAAALINHPIHWFDTGLYHLGAMRWLSTYGAVPGIALLNDGFGFTSAWFALSAAWLPNILGSRVGAITNGFIFVAAISSVLIAISQVQNKRFSDYFLISTFVLLTLSYTITIFSGSPILISFSPDVPVAFLINVFAWMTLVILENRNQVNKELEKNRKIKNLTTSLLPLIISTGAFSNKLSALPLLFTAFVFSVFHKGYEWKKSLIALSLTLMLLFPLVSNSIITSGCPMFPSTALCLPVDWRVPQGKTNNHLKVITVIGKESPDELSFKFILQKRIDWFKSQRKAQVMIASFLLCIALLIKQEFFRSKIEEDINGVTWVLGVNFLGMSFIFLTSPLIRFGLGYFVVPPALALALFLYKTHEYSSGFLNYIGLFGKRHRKSLVTLVISFSLITGITMQKNWTSNWLLPPNLPVSPPMVMAKVNDFIYTYPANSGQCWDAGLPCRQGAFSSYQVRLRKPEIGLSGGFIYMNVSE